MMNTTLVQFWNGKSALSCQMFSIQAMVQIPEHFVPYSDIFPVVLFRAKDVSQYKDLKKVEPGLKKYHPFMREVSIF